MIEKLFGNIFRGVVEGLGSRTVTLILAGIVSALVAPVLFTKFGVSPEMTFQILVGIAGVVVLGVFNRWHLDASTGGKSSTSALLMLKAMQGLEKKLPDGTPYDLIVRQVIEAMQKQGAEPPAVVPQVAPPQA